MGRRKRRRAMMPGRNVHPKNAGFILGIVESVEEEQPTDTQCSYYKQMTPNSLTMPY